MHNKNKKQKKGEQNARVEFQNKFQRPIPCFVHLLLLLLLSLLFSYYLMVFSARCLHQVHDEYIRAAWLHGSVGAPRDSCVKTNLCCNLGICPNRQYNWHSKKTTFMMNSPLSFIWAVGLALYRYLVLSLHKLVKPMHEKLLQVDVLSYLKSAHKTEVICSFARKIYYSCLVSAFNTIHVAQPYQSNSTQTLSQMDFTEISYCGRLSIQNCGSYWSTYV